MTRPGAMDITSDATPQLDFFTLYTTLNIEYTGNYADNSQKDFESILQVIGLRAMPTILTRPVKKPALEMEGAPSLSGQGYVLDFSFELEGVHSLSTLTQELNGIVLNSGTISTVSPANLEFIAKEPS